MAIGRFTSSKCLNKFSLLILLMAKAVARAIPKFCMFNRVIFPGIHWGGKYSLTDLMKSALGEVNIKKFVDFSIGFTF